MLKRIFYTLLFSIFACFSAQSQLIIKDGDSFNYQGQEIRIYGIDAVEYSQGEAAELSKYYLTTLLKKGDINLQLVNIDKYNRKVCIVYSRGKDVGYEMVKAGMAFVHPYFCQNTNYLEAQEMARKKKLGIHNPGIIENNR